MKTFLVLFLALTGFAANADPILGQPLLATKAKKVILDNSTTVYFAPLPFTGTSGVKVTNAGAVIRYNNKGVETVVTRLSAVSLQKLKQKIEAVVNGPLPPDQEPLCADAPSSNIIATKANGEAVTIYQNANCQEKVLTGAENLIEVANSIRNLSDLLQ